VRDGAGSREDEESHAQRLATNQERLPAIRGRVVSMRVPLDRATFRNAATGSELRKLIEDQLKVLLLR
jgi:hypothetical protein